MKIAVFLNLQGNTIPLGDPGVITLFRRDNTGWFPEMSQPFALSWQLGLAEIRQQILTLLAALPDCQHIVAHEIHGALLAWLDGMGMTMWQCQGAPDTFLDRIASQIAATATPSAVIPLPTTFIQPTGKTGEYRVDLMEALRQSSGGHTSKHVLVPFFQQREFTRLDVTCDHMPKWFDSLATWQLAADVVSQPDGTLCVTVTPQQRMTVPSGTDTDNIIHK